MKLMVLILLCVFFGYFILIKKKEDFGANNRQLSFVLYFL